MLVCMGCRVWPLVWFTVAGPFRLSVGAAAGGRGHFCLPPARSSSTEMDAYFQEGAVIITVEVQRKWLWVVLLLLSHCFWRLAAPCFDCFVWLPVVGFALLFRDTAPLNVCKWVCECLQALSGKLQKHLLIVCYLMEWEYLLNSKSKYMLTITLKPKTHRGGASHDACQVPPWTHTGSSNRSSTSTRNSASHSSPLDDGKVNKNLQATASCTGNWTVLWSAVLQPGTSDCYWCQFAHRK